MRSIPILVLPLLACGSCASWFFSGLPAVDRSRPVALVETIAGAEPGATTELGVLTLGRAATSGPCRVHYFLGNSPVVDDGHIEPAGGPFHRAAIDLRTQHLRILERPLADDDAIVVMHTPDGLAVRESSARLFRELGVTGDVLDAGGADLPAGAAVLVHGPDGLRFCGLVSARAELTTPHGSRVLHTFAGVDRIRELLAVPEPYPTDYRARYRPDDIIVLQPVRPADAAPPTPPPATPAPRPRDP